jgi:hypothetical protein
MGARETQRLVATPLTAFPRAFIPSSIISTAWTNPASYLLAQKSTLVQNNSRCEVAKRIALL